MTEGQAIRPNGTCIRCGSTFGERKDCRCQECGVHASRLVRRIRRHKVNGKRGRNSGKVSQHGKK